MNRLYYAGLAGFLAVAPVSAHAAIEAHRDVAAADLPVDIGFASSAALAAGVQGGKASHGGAMAGGYRGGGGHRMSHGGYGAGRNYVRQGRIGYGRGYYRPYRGFILPSAFINPGYYIGNYGYYGLSRPAYGYGWSRYYDDAVLTDRRGVVQETRNDVDWDRYNQGYQDGYRDGRATYDQGVFLSDDRVVAHQTATTGGTTVYQGDWNGGYREDGSYQGDWNGTYRDATGQTYQGQYSGTFTGNGNSVPVGTDYAQTAPHWESVDRAYENRGEYAYDDRSDAGYLEQCRKSSGIGGAIAGGAVGAVAGNIIAKRGDKLAGSLIGGGVGAIAGAALDQATDRCRKLLKQYEKDRARGQREYYGGQQQYSTGWQGGYYPAYYYPQPTVTTVVINSAPVTTTTTTTTVEEEYVYSKPQYASKKVWKPAAKRVWKPAPSQLKGCQQERCLYDD